MRTALFAMLVLTSCGSATGVSPTETGSASTSAPSAVESSSSSASVLGADVGELDLQRFEIEGAEVWTRSVIAELPAQATAIQLTTVFSDGGSGVAFCIGPMPAMGGPVRCGGPIVDNLTLGTWAEKANEVTWGHRRVSMTWPPEDGRVRALEDFPADLPTQPPANDEGNPFVLPESCKQIGPLVDVAVLQEWAIAHPDRAGLVYLADGGPQGVLGVVGDPEAVRAELRGTGAEPCVIEVDFTDAEMKKAQEAIIPLQDAVTVLMTGYGGLRNRVEVSVAVADQATVRRLIAVVDDPRILSVTGTATILAGG